MLKHLGLISILIMWAGTLYMLRGHRPEQHKTISQHAAKNHKYHIWYAFLEIFVVSMFAVFLYGWFFPRFDFGITIMIVGAIGIITTVLAAVIPERGKIHSRAHKLAAYGMAASLPAMNIALLINPQIAPSARVITLLCTVLMAAIWTLIALRIARYTNNQLRIQLIYYLAFHLPILTATYLS